MSSNKLVTIIIPTYNTVPEILPSGNAEYLIIDDGSVKEVAETIDKKYGKIKDVKIIHQKNAGVASARNRGIKESKTKYIYFFDADDEYVGEELIVKLAALAEVKNVKAVGGSMLEIRMDGSLFNDWDGFNSGFVFRQEGYIKYNDYQFDYGFYRFVYERQFLIDNNIYFPKLKRFQDPPFFVKALYTAQVFYAVPMVTYRYRVGITNWTKHKVKDCLKGILMNVRFARQYKLNFLFLTSYGRLEDFATYIKKYNKKICIIIILLQIKVIYKFNFNIILKSDK